MRLALGGKCGARGASGFSAARADCCAAIPASLMESERLAIAPVALDRPGHALLSSVLGSVTGLTQLRLAVVFPLLLVSVFALALGAFVRTCFGVDRMGWAVTVAVAGPLLGTTRLVGDAWAR